MVEARHTHHTLLVEEGGPKIVLTCPYAVLYVRAREWDRGKKCKQELILMHLLSTDQPASSLVSR